MSKRNRTKKFSFEKLDEVQKELVAEHWETERDKEIELKFSVKPMNDRQERYINAIETSVLTFAVGPAGTGRTFVACGVAAKLLKEKKIERIILARPAIECGESIGYLPGSAIEKISGFMFPMLDALGEFLGEKQVNHLIAKDIIRLSPLAQMRGSSFKNSMILLDEAQNANWTTLVMALTRIGQNCTMVVSGDYTQSDLKTKDNDLLKMIKKLEKLPEVAIVRFEKEHIVRSGIVRSILECLD